MPIYLDSAATTPVLPEASQVAFEVMTEGYGNPSSLYTAGQDAAARLKQNRCAVAARLGCPPDTLIFTSGGTEGNNWALFSGARLAARHGKHLITTAVEHAAVLEPIKELERAGWSVTRLRPDRSGRITVADFCAALRPETSLVSIMLVNNETGVLFPVGDCARRAKERNPQLLFHTDAVQGFLQVPFTPQTLDVDLLTISGHKIGAPKGIGALYIKKGLRLSPLLFGGGQESGLRPGTEPTAQAAALAAACNAWDESRPRQVAETRLVFLSALATVPGLEVISAGDAPHICAVSLPGYPSEMLVRALSDRGIYLSSGSACHRGKPSHVFAAMRLDKRILAGMLRISLSPANTPADATLLADALRTITAERVSL